MTKGAQIALLQDFIPDFKLVQIRHDVEDKTIFHILADHIQTILEQDKQGTWVAKGLSSAAADALGSYLEALGVA